MADHAETWDQMAERTARAAAKVKPPAKVAPSTERAYEAEQIKFKHHLLNLVPAVKTAPIYVVSTHGAYDLRSAPKPWVVPENTYIFETQSISDTTLTSIDNILWKLCLSKYRPAFFHYFMGNRWFFDKKGKAPSPIYTELFRNLILYKPGDIIYERDLTIGGGHKKEADGSARQSYVNMGFYKFDLSTPPQFPPKTTTERPMVPSEIAELDNLRTTLIADEDFTITNYEYVNMINGKKPIEYKGLKAGKTQLLEARSFMYDDSKEPVKIFIFSSCAAVNCNPPYPKIPKGTSKENVKKINAEHEKAIKAAYKSHECNRRIQLVEGHQRDIAMELVSMGIGTGPGGSGWDLDIEPLEELGLASPELRIPKVKGGIGHFLPSDYVEKYAKIDPDLADWWSIVGDDEGDLPGPINPLKPREIMAGGKHSNTKRFLQKTRKTRKSRK